MLPIPTPIDLSSDRASIIRKTEAKLDDKICTLLTLVCLRHPSVFRAEEPLDAASPDSIVRSASITQPKAGIPAADVSRDRGRRRFEGIEVIEDRSWLVALSDLYIAVLKVRVLVVCGYPPSHCKRFERSIPRTAAKLVELGVLFVLLEREMSNNEYVVLFTIFQLCWQSDWV